MNNSNNAQFENPKINIGIIGLGAIGCLLSSQIPSHISIFALPSNPELSHVHFQLDEGGLAEQYRLPVWQGETLDVVIICCKATQCLAALNLWQKAISKKSQIVLLQNGMGQHELVSSRFPNHVIFAASTTEGAFKIESAFKTEDVFKKGRSHIIHAGQGTTQWGYYSGPTPASIIPLALDISQFKGQHKWSDDIKAVLFSKLALNAIINPLTVKYKCNNGELISNQKIKQEVKNLCIETEAFFKVMQWPLNFNLTKKVISVAELTAKNTSSMLQDIQAQRETEIDFINGYLLNKAEVINHSLPEHQKLFDFIKSHH
jgi:2-dehydropantoate 2-reductase